MTHFGKNLPLPAGGSLERSMAQALVEDSIGRPFGGQGTSHYFSDRRENRNTCFLTVVFREGGRQLGSYPETGFSEMMGAALESALS